MSKNNIIVAGFLAIALMGINPMIAGIAQADTFTVTTTSDNDCSGDNDCDFQSALTAAQDNLVADVINVAAGTYKPNSLLTYVASGSGSGRLTIQGAGAATTILDGQSSTQILKLDAIKSSFGSGANNLIIKDLTFRNGVGTSEAGGLQARAISSNITIENCVFEGNSSSTFSAIAAAAEINASSAANACSAAILRNNVVRNNTGGVGGVRLKSCNVEMDGNIIEDNQGMSGQGGAYAYANNTQVGANNVTVINNEFNRNVGTSQGGLYVLSRNLATVQGNSFVANSGGQKGGGLYLTTNGNITGVAAMVQDNLFQSNATTGSDPGGGLYIVRTGTYGGSYYTVVNNVFLNNSSNNNKGSGINFAAGSIIYASRLNFTNNTATMNSGTAVNIDIRTSQDWAYVYNNIIRGNDSDLEIVDSSASENATSRVFNNDMTSFARPTGTKKTEGDNVDVDPLFVDGSNGDVHLQAASPVINAGLNSAPGIPSTDFDGEARIQRSVVDMGADETDVGPVFPDIDVTDSVAPTGNLTIPFGDVTQNTTETQSVTVGNTGNADLNIGTITLTNGAAFAISADNCSSMAITPTQAPCTVNIEFTPDSGGAFADTLTIPSDDPNENPVEVVLRGNGVTPQPEISVKDSVAPDNDLSISFGSVQENTTPKTETVTVENIGAAALSVGSLVLANGTAFAIAADNCTGTTVAASGNCTVDVEFGPTATGTFNDTLTIPSDDPNNNSIAVALSGVGTATPVPDIVVTDTSGNATDRTIVFSTLTAGSTTQEAVTIVNNGTADLVVDSIDLVYNATFTISSTSCSPLPITLTSSESCFVTVLFAPSDSGSHADTLSIISNDAGDNPVVVAVSGDALAVAVNNPPNSFNLIFPADGQVDVAVPTEFRWDPATDPDGDPVTYDLFVCTQSDFTECAPINTTPITASLVVKGTMFAGTGLSLMVFGFILTGDGRRRWLAAALLVIVLLAGTLFTSCRLWDWDGSEDEVMFTVDTLSSDTQYYWKVVASDGTDTTDSAVWSFTTAP